MPADLSTQHIQIAGEPVPVRIRHNPRARRYILRLDHKTGDIIVTSPTKKGMGEALAFAQKEAAWIADRRAKMPRPEPYQPGLKLLYRGDLTELIHTPGRRATRACEGRIEVSGDLAFFARRTEDFLKKEARAALLDPVARHTRALGLPLPRVTVRDTSSRWGSCSSSGTLSFCWRLILAPPWVLDYVAAHECAHLKHHNHSKAFWSLVARLDPDWQAAETWLSTHGADLFRYGRGNPVSNCDQTR